MDRIMLLGVRGLELVSPMLYAIPSSEIMGLLKKVSLVIDVLLVLGAKEEAVPAIGVIVPTEVAADVVVVMPKARLNSELLGGAGLLLTDGNNDEQMANISLRRSSKKLGL